MCKNQGGLFRNVSHVKSFHILMRLTFAMVNSGITQDAFTQKVAVADPPSSRAGLVARSGWSACDKVSNIGRVPTINDPFMVGVKKLAMVVRGSAWSHVMLPT